MRTRFVLAAFFAVASVAMAQSVAGLWDATVNVNGVDIPFRIEFAGSGANVKGWFFNGDEKVVSTGGRFENGSLVLSFDGYASKLEATLKDGTLDGKYGRDEKRAYPFHARRFSARPATAEQVPSIAGLWDIQVKSPKGESAWHFIVRQTGSEVSAAILRIDGDTGLLTGSYQNGGFVLSHFEGARPLLLEVTPAPDGSLEIIQNGKNKMTAVRSMEARAKGLPEPNDPMHHTTVKDPSEPFSFRFPDLNGHIVANTDARFRGKVVIVAISGSWCPNCHDEAPFLTELYRKYHKLGLEVVALTFEEPEQQKDLSRLRTFMKEYGIEYPVLLAGEPGEVNAKIPQAVNLNAWPTTFFLGRDGTVKSVHVGFAAPATGEFHGRMKEEITAVVERLLAENAVTSRR